MSHVFFVRLVAYFLCVHVRCLEYLTRTLQYIPIFVIVAGHSWVVSSALIFEVYQANIINNKFDSRQSLNCWLLDHWAASFFRGGTGTLQSQFGGFCLFANGREVDAEKYCKLVSLTWFVCWCKQEIWKWDLIRLYIIYEYIHQKLFT